jgi:hypothetical protein
VRDVPVARHERDHARDSPAVGVLAHDPIEPAEPFG